MPTCAASKHSSSRCREREFTFRSASTRYRPAAEGEVRYHRKVCGDITDKVVANNVAKILVNPDLPVTGARVGTVLALGGALVLLGAGVILVARRRRTA